tara:strand:+ start:143983 stop:144837 length:855 start_codon:yes stop_codon:yes gene_type:complete
MLFENVSAELAEQARINLDNDGFKWMEEKIKATLGLRTSRDFFMAYSLLASKLDPERRLKQVPSDSGTVQYLYSQKATVLQVGRVYLLVCALEADKDFFSPNVARIIQVADTGELETFLKYLVLLPSAENYKYVAVDALRTNIATVFDAIALNNPYPGRYFDDAQWNQMYLKAAFMQRDLDQIMDVDKRANGDLARIISDYAHERWAASRTVDPYFWRPVSPFLQGPLLQDMKRLLESADPLENRVGAICCSLSKKEGAQKLLSQYPDLEREITENKISWKNLK